MIKGVTFVRSVRDFEFQSRFSRFLSALGFEHGAKWETGEGKGSSFLAPVGNIEVASGWASDQPEIWVEVTGLDSIESSARNWMVHEWGEKTAGERMQPAQESSWKSRYFTVEPVPDCVLAFWEWNDPLRGKPLAVAGDLSAHGMRFAVVVSRWNAVITERLLQGALDALLRSGAKREDVQVIRVPGAWEIPLAARQAAETGEIDAVVTLGVLLRGETDHYEAIYNEVARGIGQSQQETGIPHAFGVLTCETLEQALQRAGLKAGNKGFEAAVAAIEMVSLHEKVAGPGSHQPGGSGAHWQ